MAETETKTQEREAAKEEKRAEDIREEVRRERRDQAEREAAVPFDSLAGRTGKGVPYQPPGDSIAKDVSPQEVQAGRTPEQGPLQPGVAGDLAFNEGIIDTKAHDAIAKNFNERPAQIESAERERADREARAGELPDRS